MGVVVKRGSYFWRHKLTTLYGNICHLCKRTIDMHLPIESQWSWTKDHIIPLALNGTNSIDNHKPAHKICNSMRGHNDLPWEPEGGWPNMPEQVPIIYPTKQIDESFLFRPKPKVIRPRRIEHTAILGGRFIMGIGRIIPHPNTAYPPEPNKEERGRPNPG